MVCFAPMPTPSIASFDHIYVEVLPIPGGIRFRRGTDWVDDIRKADFWEYPKGLCYEVKFLSTGPRLIGQMFQGE